MIKKIVLALTMAAATTVNANETSNLDPFRAKVDTPIEFANFEKLYSIWNPIELDECTHKDCSENIVNI